MEFSTKEDMLRDKVDGGGVEQRGHILINCLYMEKTNQQTTKIRSELIKGME